MNSRILINGKIPDDMTWIHLCYVAENLSWLFSKLLMIWIVVCLFLYLLLIGAKDQWLSFVFMRSLYSDWISKFIAFLNVQLNIYHQFWVLYHFFYSFMSSPTNILIFLCISLRFCLIFLFISFSLNYSGFIMFINLQ